MYKLINVKIMYKLINVKIMYKISRKEKAFCLHHFKTCFSVNNITSLFSKIIDFRVISILCIFKFIFTRENPSMVEFLKKSFYFY